MGIGEVKVVGRLSIGYLQSEEPNEGDVMPNLPTKKMINYYKVIIKKKMLHTLVEVHSILSIVIVKMYILYYITCQKWFFNLVIIFFGIKYDLYLYKFTYLRFYARVTNGKTTWL